MEFLPVVFAKGSKWQSYLIRAATWSRHSHCGVLHDGDLWHDGRLYTGLKVIESVGGIGTVVTPWDEFKNRYNPDAINFGLLPVIDSSADAYKRLQSELGKGYDFKMLAGYFFRTGWDDPKSWSCSELIAYASGIYRKERIARVCPEKIWCNSMNWQPDIANPDLKSALISA